MNPSSSIFRTLALAVLLPALPLAASELESALRAARPGKTSDLFHFFTPSFELFQHRFGVRDTDVVERGDDRYTLAGELTRLGRDGAIEDVIGYRITRGKSAIEEVAWRINGGAWTPLSAAVAKALNEYRSGRALTPAQQREHKRAVESVLEKSVDQSWRSAAEFLIGHIAIRDC